jgi:hypothetical protein
MIGRPTTSLRRALVFCAAAAVVFAACSSSAGSLRDFGGAVDSSGGTGTQGGVKVVGGPAQPAASAAAAEAPDGNGSTAVDGSLTAPSDLLIVKTGTLALQVKGLDAAIAAATAKISSLGGYVSGSQRMGDGQSAVASVTYRIPAARWDDALAGLRGLADKVVSEQTQTDEVTGQVVDLAARIANLQATERALQAIMDRAVKISDVLEVQGQLTQVRGEIEQLATQKKHLEEQAAFGTLGVTYGLETVAVEQAKKGFDPAGEADRATASLVEIGQALAAAGIWFAILWLPILLVLAVLALVALIVLRRLRRDQTVAPVGPMGPVAPSTPA